MMNLQQNKDGTWTPAVSVGPKGAARLERLLLRRGFTRLASLVGRLDERGLGR